MPNEAWHALSDDNRRLIVNTAVEEFSRRGFTSGSINMIAMNAGLPRNAIFEYFDTKLELFLHVAEFVCSEVLNATMGSRELSSEDPLFDQIAELVGLWLDYFDANSGPRGVALAITSEMDPVARPALRSLSNSFFNDALAPLVKLASNRGELRDDVEERHLLVSLILLLCFLDQAPYFPSIDPVSSMVNRSSGEVKPEAIDLLKAIERGYCKVPSTL